MTARCETHDPRALLDAARRALAAASDGLDVSAVQPETPLAALVFDSLMAVNFIATLESLLGVSDLPFERWLAEHSERTDAVTVGSLIAWLGALPQLGANGAAAPAAQRSGGAGDEARAAAPEDP